MFLNNRQLNNGTTKLLSPIAVWALAFGCTVGWGSFVMPGTTFLPTAGPLGTVLGLAIGAVIMLIIGVNYSQLMKRYPDPGGAYTYAGKVIGRDHGFLCGWMLLLTYVAIIWANAAALPLIMRYLLGDVFCFGFSYQIAGYTVYFGEVLLSVVMIAAVCLICIFRKAVAKWIQIICAVVLFVGICVSFIAVIIHRGGLGGIAPAFSSSAESPALQVIGIVILAPWAFVGFESISHSSDRFRFSAKRIMPIVFVTLLTAAMSYIMLALCASAVQPEGFIGWEDYTASLPGLSGIEGIPTFYSLRAALGDVGVTVLGITAFCGIATGMIGFFIALSRLIQSMSSDGLLPRRLSAHNEDGIPRTALLLITGVSCLIPFIGRTAIGWIVDVTTVGAAIVYGYTSICAFKVGRKEKNRKTQIFGLAGTVFAAIFAVSCLLPSLLTNSKLASESYLILVFWSIFGMIVFRLLIGRDKKRRFGKSEVVWIILFILILIISVTWVQQNISMHASDIANDIHTANMDIAEEAGLNRDDAAVARINSHTSEQIKELDNLVYRDIFILAALLLGTLAVIFSIFTVIKKREKDSEARRRLAEESSKAKSIFLSNMSHDIRTPINAINGYTALALDSDDISDEIRDYFEKIEYSGKHLLSLINDILDMSRIESGKVELDLAPADLVTIMDQLNNVFALQMQTKGLDFTVSCKHIENRYVLCDENRLNRVLHNLISNALKFTPEGGSVTVTLRQVSAEFGKASYVLKVSDTGIGISSEFMEHLFDAFERERTSTVSQLQGTGLGMAIAKSIVEMMGGSIEVDSVQGKGTTFTLRMLFPITLAEDYERSVHPALPDRKDLADKHILLAEDNPINAEIAGEILKRAGFTVDFASDGRQAVDMITAAAPDHYNVVLMDIQMPVMNGYEASKAIRALDDVRAHVPIIALTANSFDTDRKEALEAGMNAFVPKPFNPTELVDTIARNIR